MSPSLGSKNLGSGRNELPEEAKDRKAENVVKSTLMFEAYLKLAPRGAPVNKFEVGVVPGSGGRVRTKGEAEVLGGEREDDLVPVDERSLEVFSAEFLEVALPEGDEDSLRDVEREA